MRHILLLVTFLLLSGFAAAQCPAITVTGPSGVTLAGDQMTFVVDVAVAGPRLDYKWTISSGTIEIGQGTTQITVRTDWSMADTNVTATVEVEGLPSSCEKIGSEMAPVTKIGCGLAADEWDDSLKPNDQRTRLDNFFADLSNNPEHTGLVVLIINEKEKLNSENRSIQLILRHARFRKFDIARIWFSLEVGELVRTKIYRFQKGAQLPCDNCTIIKGGDLLITAPDY